MTKEEFCNLYCVNWNYESVLVLYDLYYLLALDMAENMVDGIMMDEIETAYALQELKQIEQFLLEIKKENNLKLNCFEPSELVSFPNGQLKDGKMVGESDMAVQAATKWVNKENRDQFLYEAGVYILLLCGQEVFF